MTPFRVLCKSVINEPMTIYASRFALRVSCPTVSNRWRESPRMRSLSASGMKVQWVRNASSVVLVGHVGTHHGVIGAPAEAIRTEMFVERAAIQPANRDIRMGIGKHTRIQTSWLIFGCSPTLESSSNSDRQAPLPEKAPNVSIPAWRGWKSTLDPQSSENR